MSFLLQTGKYAGKKSLSAGSAAFKMAETAGRGVVRSSNFLSKATSPFSSMATSKYVPGVMTLASPFFGTYSSITNYDPEQHESRGMEVAKSLLSADVVGGVLSSAAFEINPLLGIGVSALEFSGRGISSLVETAVDTAGLKYEQSRYGNRAPIRQNENTMRATNQTMSLLGQAGFGGNEVINPQSFAARKRGLLGSEAMLMHN
jgi:hypothetical protein